MNLLQLKQSIKKYEGLELKPYRCPAGKITIGYGRNLEDNGITLQEAEKMLENDLLRTKLELEDRLPIFRHLDDVRRNVLIEMAFNMGVPKLLKFKKTISFLKVSDFESASSEMLNSKWHEDFKKYDMQDGISNNNGLLRSEYLSKLMKEGRF